VTSNVRSEADINTAVPVEPHNAVQYIFEISNQFAKAKGERRHLEEFRKSKKALLFSNAPEDCKTIQAKEAYAYAHGEYMELLEGLKRAVEVEETLKYRLISAQLRVEVWRTEQANSRFTEKT
jgi:hypothetical protein